ncbi:MAG: fatty acid desaturase [Planctomycetota bacterium JB042]
MRTETAPPPIPWRDLVPLSAAETAVELVAPLPWLAGALVAAERGLDPLAAVAAFFFFLAALRLVHDLMHGNLGLPRLLDHVALTVMSAAMLSSVHAVLVSHGHHHRHTLADDDVEARAARMSGLGAILFGPLFTFGVHLRALRTGSRRQVAWVTADLVAVAAVVVLALASGMRALQFHVVAMAAANSLTAFFCVWTVHRGCRADGVVARTLRGRVGNRIFFHMFLHLEHHWFPRVPTRRLARLAERIDRATGAAPPPGVFARDPGGA